MGYRHFGQDILAKLALRPGIFGPETLGLMILWPETIGLVTFGPATLFANDICAFFILDNFYFNCC